MHLWPAIGAVAESGVGAAVRAAPTRSQGCGGSAGRGPIRQGDWGVGGSAEAPAGVDEACGVVAVRVGVLVDGVEGEPG